jgi:DNA-binding Lrp family transcriptional regulator
LNSPRTAGAISLKAETVRVFGDAAFTIRRIREVLKQLDPTNIKILSTMATIGPRNLLEVSRLTGIPFTTVYHRVGQIESKSKAVVHLLPDVATLGMTRVVVLVAAKPGLEDVVTEALKVPNYWRVIERCEGAFSHHSIQTIPDEFLKEFREYISTMQAMNLIKSFRIIQTGNSYPVFPDFSSYNSSSGEWIFDWEGWLNAVKGGDPTETIQDRRHDPVAVKRIDLEIISYLEEDGRMKFTDIAEKIGTSPQTVKYRYDNNLFPTRIVGTYDFIVWPYPVEVSSFHEFMLEFPDAVCMNKFFSAVKSLFFINQVAKTLRKNTLLVRTRILNSQVENMFTFFSELVNAGQLTSYSTVRLNVGSRLRQTISYELFDPVSGWRWDVYRNLLELNRL